MAMFCCAIRCNLFPYDLTLKYHSRMNCNSPPVKTITEEPDLSTSFFFPHQAKIVPTYTYIPANGALRAHKKYEASLKKKRRKMRRSCWINRTNLVWFAPRKNALTFIASPPRLYILFSLLLRPRWSATRNPSNDRHDKILLVKSM